MGRHYGCRAPRKANRLRRQLKRGPKLAPHHRRANGKQVWNFSEVALFRMKQNKSLKVQNRQLKVKINALALSKRFYSMKRSSEDRWNQLGLHLWNAESLEEQKFLETEPQHAARGGLDMTCPVEIMAAMNANDTALCPCKSKRCKCRRNLDDDHKNEKIHQDLSKLKEYQGLLDDMLDYEDQLEQAGKKATFLWFDEFKERLWRGPSLKNTFFKRNFFAHLQQSISTESVRQLDCHQIQAFLEGGGAEHMLDSAEWEKFLRRLVWVLCSEPVELQGRCSKRQRMQFRDNQGGPPKPNQRPGLTRKAHFGAGCYELVKYIQGRFAAHLTPNSLKDPKEIQEQKHHASFMASHRDLAKLNGMQEQLKAHVEIGASKMTGKMEDKKGKKYSSSKAKAGVTSASKSTTKGKKEQDAGVAVTEVTGESEKPQKSAKVKVTKLTKSKVKTRFETRVGKKSLEQMKEMLKELEERPGDVMLAYRSLQEILAAWRRKAIPVTGTGKNQKSCGKLAKYINFIVPKVYKVPCGIGPLNLLGELLPKRELTHEKSLRRLPEPNTPLDLQAELTMLASLLEHYPKELLLWQLLAAALLDENMTPRVVFNAFMPRFSAWNHQFFGLHKGMAGTASTFRTLRQISCILILIMAYLLDSKVAELLDLMAQRGFHESLDGEYGDCRDLWPKQVKTKLQDLLTGIAELPLRERTQQLLGDLSEKYDSLFGKRQSEGFWVRKKFHPFWMWICKSD